MSSLKLGLGREIITPEVGGQLFGYRPDVFSSSVMDDLTATVFYFEQGDVRALMVSVTVCLIHNDLAKRIQLDIEKNFGIAKENCMICATHTHSGPNTSGMPGWGDIDEKYCEEIFIPQILAAVKSAVANPVPVKVGMAFGKSEIGINRRELDINNNIVLGQNPWGCYNPQMTVISFKDNDGRPYANIVHYGAHCTAAGPNSEITRDWAGIMIDSLEAESGAMTAFLNGPEGDVGPRLTSGFTEGGGNIRYVKEIGYAAAMDAVGIFKKICEWRDAELCVSSGQVNIPLQPRPPLEFAVAELEKFSNETVNLKGTIAVRYRNIIESYENGYEEKESDGFVQTVMRIGNIAFVNFPYELFSEIGMRIDRESSIPHVLSLSNTNGNKRYFVTQDQLCRGGYEVDMFVHGHIQSYVDNADWYLIKETLKNLESNGKDNI